MGFILSQRHPGEVYQILLHYGDLPRALGTEVSPAFTGFLEDVMALRSHTPVGFDVEGSPFAMLRDSTCLYFRDRRLGFVDYTPGYIYLARHADILPCRWIEDYVTDGMFLAGKPFYVSLGKHYGHNFRNAGDVNRLMPEIMGRN